MNEQRQELDERIADDERHAATMRKARDYDDLLARAEAAEARAAELAETLENIICALGLNPVDYSDELTEPLITGVIAAMQQRAAELEAALDAAERERDDANDWQPVDTVPLETDVLLILRGQVFGQPGRQWVLATDEPFFCWRSV